MSSKHEAQRLADSVDNINAIQSYVGTMGYTQFAGNRLVVDATERCLERIIEAVIKIGPTRAQSLFPNQPIAAIRALGNRLRHEYDLIDVRLIYSTVVDELPELRVACCAELNSLQ